MAFQFSLGAVLQARQQQHDIQLQALAAARSLLTQQVADRDQLIESRFSLLAELREFNDHENFPVVQVMHRQRHAEQLAKSITDADSKVLAAEQQLQKCLDSLVTAKQSVRALEMLAERQFVEYQVIEARLTARELDDITTSAMHRSR